MITLELTEDQLLALARVLTATSGAQAGAQLEDGEQYSQWREARKIIDDQATSVIHSYRSTRP